MENSFTYESAKERIITRPFNISWEAAQIHEQETSAGCISEKGKFNFEGCNDLEKLIIYILGWNLSDTCPFKRTISKYFGWTPYKVAKLVKMSDGIIEITPVFNEDNGLLAGKGYVVENTLVRKSEVNPLSDSLNIIFRYKQWHIFKVNGDIIKKFKNRVPAYIMAKHLSDTVYLYGKKGALLHRYEKDEEKTTI